MILMWSCPGNMPKSGPYPGLTTVIRAQSNYRISTRYFTPVEYLRNI